MSTLIFILAVIGVGVFVYFIVRPKKKAVKVIPDPVIVAPPPVIEIPPVVVDPKPDPIPDPVIEPVKYRLVWPDRRPIASIHLASAPHAGSPHEYGNKRWKLLGEFQFSRDALMRHADECIKFMTELNAQGMVTWNIEGEEFYHPHSYIGDPRILPPEMEALADEYFAKFKGFKTGVCLRLDEVRWIGGWPHHYTVADPVKNLAEKIQYAKDRWGCTLFYVDSNVGHGLQKPVDKETGEIIEVNNTIGAGGLIPASVFAELAAMFPDCLIMPEHYDWDYFNTTAPWCDGRWKDPFGKGEPGTFKVVSGAREDLLPAIVKEGNILMFSGWWADPYNQAVKQAYDTKEV